MSPSAGDSGSLLSVRDLEVRFGTGAAATRAVDGVSLELRPGETLAVVGESGCGKTTLARAIAGLERPAGGSVRFDGVELTGLPTRARRRLASELQMIFQDPYASLNPRMTAEAIVAEPILLHERLGRAERTDRVCELLARVGLDPALRRRYPHEFSGGQRQRICIARALASRPRLVLCDEAVSALDVSVQAQILNLLADLREEFSLSYLFITHDLGVVRQLAQRVAVMYVGQIVEEAPVEALFAAPRHPYTRALLEAVPAVGGDARWLDARLPGEPASPARPPSGCRFHPRCPEAFDRCRAEAPPLHELPDARSRCFLAG